MKLRTQRLLILVDHAVRDRIYDRECSRTLAKLLRQRVPQPRATTLGIFHSWCNYFYHAQHAECAMIGERSGTANTTEDLTWPMSVESHLQFLSRGCCPGAGRGSLSFG